MTDIYDVTKISVSYKCWIFHFYIYTVYILIEKTLWFPQKYYAAQKLDNDNNKKCSAQNEPVRMISEESCDTED